MSTTAEVPRALVASALDCLVLTPSGTPDAALAVAASRAGAVGVLDVSLARDAEAAAAALRTLLRSGRGRRGAAVLGLRRGPHPGATGDAVFDAVLEVAAGLDLAVLDAAAPTLVEQFTALRRFPLQIAVLVRSVADLEIAAALGPDALVAKGNEAGGPVEEESELILLQRLTRLTELPVWAYGGIGLHSAAAALVGGATGIVLDSQLLLTRESPLPDAVRALLAGADGSETACPGSDLGRPVRLHSRPGLPALVELRELEARLLGDPQGTDPRATWDTAVADRIDWTGAAGTVLALGQDIGSAAPLADAHVTVGGVIAAMLGAATGQCRQAAADSALAEDSSLARRLGTRYPVVQGPMTRVSDRAQFAAAVADGGGLPFLALSLLRGPEVSAVLQETRELLGDRSWGAGILAFVPDELRAEQQAAVRAAAPPWVVLAGGAPAQARELEDQGIATFLHVPSPGLLRIYVEAGLRRFVFEGRECGGHVGPRSSLVLWDTAVRTLLALLPPGRSGGDYEILFAGGISDADSAAMAAAVAAPLTARGVHFGVLVGTAYLFTPEAVTTGAITAEFQLAALAAQGTTLLESGPGHLTRALLTPYATDFASQRRTWVAEGVSPADLRDRLEARNIGRLRVAAKGIDRVDTGEGSALRPVDADTQRSQGLYMIGQVAALHEGVRSIAELHDDLGAGSTARLASLPLDAGAAAPPATPRPAVAIIGMGTMLPGAPDLRTFWANIVGKVDAVTEIPADRWDWRRHFDPDRTTPDKVYGRWGGFVDDAAFDPVAFGMPPASVASIEPFQLLGLLTAQAALRDAGYATRAFARERTAVILGAGGGGADLVAGYMTRSMLPEIIAEPEVVKAVSATLPEWTEDSFPGLLMNVAAGRIANRLDLGGSNFTVDAACGSSLAAVMLAVRELQAGTAELAIAGGVDAIQNPFAYLCFSKTQALSPTGRCRPFDTAADGIAISEGYAMVVLKRLEDAERDGDHVYAVIRGVGSSSDGRDRSLTAPRPEGQVRALHRAYAEAGFAPSTVSLVEAHGTGTVAGDRAEAQSLGAVFGESGAAEESCAVGSVKSMIGHTKATAGVAGLVKTALALDAKVIPPTLGVTTPNPAAGAGSPFYVSAETRPWISTNGPRRAGVSAFGFGGTNFHVLLEEHVTGYLPDTATTLDRWPAELFSFSAPDAARLGSTVTVLADALAAGARPELADLAYSLALRDQGGPARLAVVAGSAAELERRLRRAAGELAAGRTRVHDLDGVHLAVGASTTDPAFLFPGQGSQYVAMAAELAAVFPLARRRIEQADAVLQDKLTTRLSRRIFPPPTFTPEDAAARTRELTDTRIAQPALGAVELAYAAVLGSLGVQPAMTAGHSYGELVALAVAGRLSEDDLLRLSADRGRLIVDHAVGETGTMAAVDAADLGDLLQSHPALVLANRNGPRQTVVSGPTAAVEAALGWCREHDLPARRIPVACAFHSPLVEPAQRALAEVLASTDVAEGRVPVFSNSTAQAYPPGAAQARALLAGHLTRPVDFVGEIEAMWDAGARVFVECGPRAVLTGLVEQILAGREHVVVPVDRPGRGGVVSLLECLATLRVEGVPVAVDRLFRGRTVRPLDPARLPLQPPAPAPSSYLVNGSRARRVTQPPGPRYTPVSLPRSAPPAPSLAPRTETAMPETHAHPLNGSAPPTNGRAAPASSEPAAPVPTSPVSTSPVSTSPVPTSPVSMSPAPADPLPDPDQAAAVMGRYQDVMQQFLETQRSVMLAYLGQGSRSARARAAVPMAAPPPLPTRAPMALAAAPSSNGNHNGDHPVGPAPSLSLPTASAVPVVSTPPAPVTPATPPTPLAPDPLPPPAIEPAPAEVLSTEAVTAALLEVVSVRTGYPTDMLGLDADLEADLGIDSIKRVEIAGQVMRALPMPESAGRQIEQVTASRTLRQVVDRLQALLSPATASSPELPPFPREPIGAGHTERLVSQLTDAPDSSTPAGLAAGAVVLVTGPQAHPVGDAVAAVLRGRGLPVVVMAAPLTDLSDPELVADLVSSVRTSHGRVAALVHLGALVPPVDASLLASMFALTQAVHSDLVAAASEGGAAVLAVRGVPGPGEWWSGGLAGFCRTLALEEPTVRVRAVELDPAEPVDSLVDALVAELDRTDPAVVVRLGSQTTTRRVAVAAPSPLQGRTPRAALGADAVVLLTGGARGITAEAALALALAYQPRLVLVGRTPLVDEAAATAGITDPTTLRSVIMAELRTGPEPLTPARVERALADLLARREVRATLSTLAAAGGRPEYISCDLRDATAFAGVVDDLYARYGRIDGVVHGAGIIEDKLVPAKTAASFARVSETKLTPARVLAERIRPETLRFCVFFSSVSARVGNRGQCDYAAANAALDALALELDSRWPAHVVSIGWGPWAGGMVSAELAAEFARRGVPLLDVADGRRTFLDELTLGHPGEVEVIVAATATAPTPAATPTPDASPTPAAGPGTSDVTRSGPPRRPLLAGSGTRSADGSGGLSMTRTFDLTRDPCLGDHRIDGQPVVPFAYVLELVAEAAAELHPDATVTAVEHLQLGSGIILAEDGATVRLEARTQPGGQVAVSVGGPDRPGRPHYSAVVLTAQGAHSAPGAPTPDPLLDGADGPGVREAYEDLLFHGPMFQGIEELRLGSNGASSVLRSATPESMVDVAPGPGWLLDPLVVDGALQLQVVWARVNWDVTLLPTSLDRVTILGDFTGVSRVRHEMRISTTSADPLCHAAHWLHDEATGRPLAHLEGMSGAGSRALNRIVGGRRRSVGAGST